MSNRSFSSRFRLASQGKRLLCLHVCRLFLLGAVLPTCAAASAQAEDAPLLSAAVARAAGRDIVPLLEKEGIKSVGVLKFLSMGGSKANDRPTTRLGAINSDLAAQFQTAILLNVSRRNPIEVLRDPSAVAAGIPGATHLSAAGQEKLFAAEYPVFIGQAGKTVKPDAFIFGIVQIGDDLKTVTVDVRLIQRGVSEARRISAFTGRLDAHELVSAGQSFVATRGLFNGGKTNGGNASRASEQAATRPVKLASLAVDVRSGRRPFPLEDADAPVTLSIAYDSVPQSIEYRDGGAFVAEPKVGQKVTVTIKKTSKDGQRYAVALKVNGENTASRGVLPDLKGSKWVLSDEFMTLPVRGYSVGTKELQPFTVLSEAESAARAFDYGVDAGTITMTVFAERSALPNDAPLTPEEIAPDAGLTTQNDAGAALDELLLSGGVRLDPTKSFESLDVAKAALQESLATASRGLIVPDSETQAFNKKIVTFDAVKDPVMSVVVRYYTTK